MMGKLLKTTKAKIVAAIFLAAMVCTSIVFAKPIDQKTAKQAALNFLANDASFVPAQPLTLVNAQAAGYYIFSNDKCFVIISADDASEPILAYSTESGFKTKNVSPEVSYILGNYSKQIKYIVNNQVPATDEISTKWTNLVNNVTSEQKNASIVTPLTKTTWDQAPFYNDLCPYDNYYQQLTVTGCVATAMAQVLKYWNYPAAGVGSNSYSDGTYGNLSVSFSNTTYDWPSMPNRLSAANSAVATLMYDCGVAVDMSYGVAATGGSAAYVVATGAGGTHGGGNQKCAQNALVNYFGYDAGLRGLTRSNYTDAQWIDTLETELSNHHPIIYSGFDSANEGHCFVFDGYNSTHNLFHVNWGWSGVYNGFYSINSLNPGSGQIGGGAGNFNLRQQAIIGIQPPATSDLGIQTAPNAAANIKVYPNPASDHITADLSGISGTPEQINFINIQGKLVYSVIPGNNVNTVTINTSNMANGVYFLQILSDKGVVNSKVVINR